MAALMFAVSADIRGGEPSAETGVLSMVADLIASPDRELRGLGLQQVREGLPGAEATEHLVKLLPRLAPETQAALIEALGDRGDRRARCAVLQGLSSPSAVVRLSALKALGVLGDAADVGALAQKAASGSQAEREVARQSLVRLRGDAVASSLLAELAKGGPPVRVELLRVLAARKALDAAPEAIRFAADPDPAVRLEAIRALRVLASARDTAAILGLLASAGGDKEREAARSALQAVCARGKEACVEVLAAALPTADPSTRIVLLHALGCAGGSQSLAFVVRGLADENREVRGEAIDVLSRWPDAAAIPELRRRALEASDLRSAGAGDPRVGASGGPARGSETRGGRHRPARRGLTPSEAAGGEASDPGDARFPAKCRHSGIARALARRPDGGRRGGVGGDRRCRETPRKRPGGIARRLGGGGAAREGPGHA